MTTDDLFAAYSAAMPALERCLDNSLLHSLACRFRSKEIGLGKSKALWEVYFAACCHFDDHAITNWWLFCTQCKSAEAASREAA